MRLVTIIGFNQTLLMDTAGPAQVFGSANTLLGATAYKMETVTEDGCDFVTDTGLTIRADKSFDSVERTDDLIIPGGPGVDAVLKRPDVIRYLKTIEPYSQRIISICSGSLICAAAGLLHGRKATTHWERSEQAFRSFPNVDWHLDKIFTLDEKFFCSAGVTAGIDLALSLVEADHGRRVALGVAREMVVFMHRHGGQSQYSAPLKAQSTSSKRLSDLYSQIIANPTENWTVQNMATLVGTTPRTLHRDFIREFRRSPSQFVEERRLAIARTYLEQGKKSIKEVASLSGFQTEQKMRRSFSKLLGILPTQYRERFGCTES